MAEHRERFLAVGAFAVVSDTRVLALCEDAWEMNDFLAVHGLRGPRTWLALPDALQSLRLAQGRFRNLK